jgi:hypothetical protein
MLYKFRTWDSDYHKDVVREQELFFPSIKRFNDPFDSNIPINYSDLTEKEQKQIITDRVEYDHPNITGKAKERKIQEYWAASYLDDPEKLKENYENIVRPQNEKEFGILSLAGNKESILMWSHYSHSHQGYCVGLDEGKLAEFSKKFGNESELIFMHPITYQEDYPNFNPAKMSKVEFSVKPLIVKSCSWEYEDEVRMIYIQGSDKKITFDKSVFSEITIGCNMSNEDKEELINAVNDEFKQLPIYQAKLAHRSFELEFERV